MLSYSFERYWGDSISPQTSTRLNLGLAHELHVLVLKPGGGDETTVVIVEVLWNDILARGAPVHVKGVCARLGGEMELLIFQNRFVDSSFGGFQQQPTIGIR